MKMYPYKEWSIGIELDTDGRGQPRATASAFQPGTGPRTPASGFGTGRAHTGRTLEEAEEKAVAAAKEWIDKQRPRKA